MATSTLKSTAITNRDATPKVANNARVSGAPLISAIDIVTTAAADDTSSTYRMLSVPSNAFVRGVYFSTAALGGSSTVDIGVFRSTADGGAVVDADFFASAVSTVNAVARTDVTYESAVFTAAKRMQPLWQAAGLSADPGGELDIVISCQATIANAAAMSLEVQYVV
jgi:hypothetical protein